MSSLLQAGCTPGPDAVDGLLALALLAVAAGFFGFGLWRERARAQRALQAARAEGQGWSALLPHWRWRTDAQHRLTQWLAVADAGSAGPAPAPPAAQALAAALAAERPLRGVRLPAAAAADLAGADGAAAGQAAGGGATAGQAAGGGAAAGQVAGGAAAGQVAGGAAAWWQLDAEPLHDADGRFGGYVGSARPCAPDDRAALDAALVAPLLAEIAGPALVATRGAAGWQVARFNAAARTPWPDLAPGQALEPLLAAPPSAPSGSGAPAPPAAPAVLGALAGLAPGQTAEVDGWRLHHLGALPGGDALLLARIAPPAAPPDEHEAFGPTLSHDLRAPIRVVEGFTRIVKEDYGRLLDRVGNEHLDRVLGAAARMNLMIDALLTQARLSAQPLARQPVNLSQLAGYVIDDLRRGAPEREVEVEIEPALAAHGDPTLLRMALENLLGNAWKYTARAARARITLRRTALDGRAAFEVADNGAGFDMRSAERLFGLFQRLHSQSDFPGHGIGLASVRRIVRRHGGEIRAHAEPGRGASFVFTLD